MLHVPVGAQSYGGIVVNYGTARPANSLGVLVTPGTSGYGSWFQLFTAQSFDAYGLLMCLSNNGTSATNRHSKVKLGIDEAGGTSYVDRIDGLLCGSTANLGPGTGAWYFFPVFIPAGFGLIWLVSPAAVFLIGAGMACVSLVLARLVPEDPREGNEVALPFRRPLAGPAE